MSPQHAFKYFADRVSGLQCSEANVQALLFHSFLAVGYSHQTVCCEFYPGPSTRDRADLAIFAEECDGRFSWYENASRARDNTELKAKTLRHLIEIKGGYTSERTVLGRLSTWLDLFLRGDVSNANPLSDIEKLVRWRSRFGSDRQYYFVCVDFPEVREIGNTDAVEKIGSICVKRGINFAYVDAGSQNWSYLAVDQRQRV